VKSIVREVRIGRENYETTITLTSADISRFSRGTHTCDRLRTATDGHDHEKRLILRRSSPRNGCTPKSVLDAIGDRCPDARKVTAIRFVQHSCLKIKNLNKPFEQLFRKRCTCFDLEHATAESVEAFQVSLAFDCL